MTRLLRDRRGAVAIEFAFAAPILLALIFVVMEGSRYMWTRQVVQETAASAVRCMSIEWGKTASTTIKCVDKAGVRTWGVARARASKVQVAIIDADIVLATSPINGCTPDAAMTGMRKVTVRSTFRSAIGRLIPSLPTAIQSSACYPLMT